MPAFFLTLTSVFIMAHVEDMSQLVSSCASGTADCPPPILCESNRECFRTHSTGEGNPHSVPSQVNAPVNVHSHNDDVIAGFVIMSVALCMWRAWEQSYVHEPPVLYIPPDWSFVVITVNTSVHMQVFTVTSTYLHTTVCYSKYVVLHCV